MKLPSFGLLAAFTVFASANAATPTGTPASMRAVRMHDAGGPEVLRIDPVPIPEPQAGQVLIRVYAAGVNPVDWKWRLRHPAEDNLRVPGRDVAGVIERVGEGVRDWKAGDAVIAMLDRPYGGYAEFTVASVGDLARKPASLSFEEGAGIPTASVTAWRYLVDGAQVRAGQRVLVHGGAGGVGSAAVQIAKARGAHVIATASERNHAYLRSIGADEVIDYNAVKFETVASHIDIVFDTVGGDTLERSPAVLRAGGSLVSVAGNTLPPRCSQDIRCVGAGAPWGADGGPALRELCALAEQGKFKVNVEKVFTLEEAGAAQESNRTGRTRGKLVIRVRKT